MEIDLYEVNAFSHRPQGGNPLAVILLDEWLGSQTLQILAIKGGKPETAFVVRRGEKCEIRCFSAQREIDLCGSAILAAAAVIMDFFDRRLRRMDFVHPQGTVGVWRHGGKLSLDLPQWTLKPRLHPGPTLAALGVEQGEVWQNRDIVVILENREQVAALRPDFSRLATLPSPLVVVSASDGGQGYVLRAFSPAAGIPEDAATATAHCTLAPYWANKLGCPHLHAEQLSPRRAEFECELLGNRVIVASQVLQVRHKLLTLPEGMNLPFSY